MEFYTSLIFLGFFVACLELAFQYFMQKNMILYPYGKLLNRLSKKNTFLCQLMKPLGCCRYCNAVWLDIFLYWYRYGWGLEIFYLIGLTFVFLFILSNYAVKNIGFGEE